MSFTLCRSWISLQSCVVLFCCIGLGLCAESPSPVNSYQPETKPQIGSGNVLQNSGHAVAKQDGNSVNDPQQYRSAYYYPTHGNHKQQYAVGVPVWNRDTYADAASDFGYNSDGGHGQQSPSYHPPTSAYGAPDEGGYTDDGFGGGASGLGGLAGLLGLKGLKGLGLLGLLKAGLLPLLFLGLPALLLIPILLFFLPIPVITIPTPTTGRRSFGVSVAEIGDKMSNLARSVMDSDKCIERITCEMSRYSRGTFVDKTLKRMIVKFEQIMPNPLQRMARAYIDPVAGSGCQRYGCFLMDDISNKKHKKTT